MRDGTTPADRSVGKFQRDSDPRMSDVPAPTPEQRVHLDSLRNELFEDDWEHWHTDPAIEYLDLIIGPDPRWANHVPLLVDGPEVDTDEHRKATVAGDPDSPADPEPKAG